MTFFQTVTLFFLFSVSIGFLARFFLFHCDDATVRIKTIIYNTLGVFLIAIIIWSLMQMMFHLPSLRVLFPIEAAGIGIICAIGLQGGYEVLKERSEMKKRNSK